MKTNETQSQIGNRPQVPDYPYGVFKVGDRTNIRFYSDVRPATVISVARDGAMVTVREDSFKLAEGQKPEIASGGFAGHCSNQRDLRYDISEDPNGHLYTFILRKWRGRYCWTTEGSSPDGYQHLSQGWRAFYDYNF